MDFKNLFKKTFLYNVYLKIRYYNRIKKLAAIREVFRKEAPFVLKKYCDALNDQGIVFWLEFGTLLGYYREHDFIGHDMDLDTGAYLKDIDKVRKALSMNGFERVHYYKVISDNGIEECYKHKDYNTTIDVFYFKEDINSLYCYSFSPLERMDKKNNLNKEMPCLVKRVDTPNCGYVLSEFKGNKVYVPSDCETYLKQHYGDSFMIPNRNFSSKKEAKNITYYTYDENPGMCYFTQTY